MPKFENPGVAPEQVRPQGKPHELPVSVETELEKILADAYKIIDNFGVDGYFDTRGRLPGYTVAEDWREKMKQVLKEYCEDAKIAFKSGEPIPPIYTSSAIFKSPKTDTIKKRFEDMPAKGITWERDRDTAILNQEKSEKGFGTYSHHELAGLTNLVSAKVRRAFKL